MITDFGRNSFVTWTTGLVERVQKAEKEIQMRPYRGKTKEGKWMYGYAIERFDNIPLENRAWIIPLRMGLRFFPGRTEVIDTIEVAPETVGQFVTKDKNGNDVFAGDNAIGVVFMEDSPPYQVRGKVEYYKASFCIVSNCTYYQINDLLEIELIEDKDND